MQVIVDRDGRIGGLNYFISLAKALNSVTPTDYKFYYLTNVPDKLALASGRNVEVAKCGIFTKPGFTFKVLKKLLGQEFFVGLYAHSYGIEFLSHCLPPLFLYKNRSLYWMPDFQHCHLPHLFTAKEHAVRNRSVEIAASTGHILFSSLSVAHDFDEYFPSYGSTKKYVLPFVPSIDFEIDSSEDDSLINGCRKTSFFLPNQFWKHKNHMVVVEALATLPPEFKVFCTGATQDYRGQEHISKLYQRITELKLEDRFIILGVVSRQRFTKLLKECCALINPSYFEGWSTTVEEAKAFGKRIILSDLKVHREQNPARAYYFSPNDASGLASAMLTAACETYDEKEEECFHKAKAGYGDSVMAFAERYLDILDEYTGHR